MGKISVDTLAPMYINLSKLNCHITAQCRREEEGCYSKADMEEDMGGRGRVGA